MNEFLLDNGTDVILPKIVGEEFVNHWEDETFTNEQHHAHFESTSSSSLKLIVDSPYTYLETMKRRQNGRGMAQTKSMKFGTIAHLIVLEPAEFRRRVVLAPKFNLTKTVDKEEWALFKLDQHPDAIIFRDGDEGRGEYENLVGVVNAIANHNKARDIFREGISERSGFFRCPRTGILTRFRPDFMSTIFTNGHLVDFKTAKSSRYEMFQKQADELMYHVQMSLYRTGYKELNGHWPDVSSWVVVENQFPYEVAVYPVDTAMITHGDNWYNYSMDLLKECIVRKQFPQRQTETETMVPSKYAMDRIIPNVGDIRWAR